MALIKGLVLSLALQSVAAKVGGNEDACRALAKRVDLDNTTLILIERHLAGSNISLPGTIASCNNNFSTTPIDLCRVVFDTASSNSSSVHIEAWLPDDWNGRLTTTGGGGLGGCVDYETMRNVASLGFASFGMNGGHNGSEYDQFLNKPEVIKDFGFRAMHVQAVVAKELVKQYYSQPSSYTYYVGCSTGGRQGLSSAATYPEDFDGMVVGAPGVEWVRIVGQWYVQALRNGWPDVTAPAYVTLAQFRAVNDKVVELYDGIDGVRNGYFDDPSQLRIDPQMFSCDAGLLNSSVCLKSAAQVESVRLAYEPQVDSRGNFVYPSLEWGNDPTAWADNAHNGTAQFEAPYIRNYFRGIVYNTSDWDDRSFTVADLEFAAEANIGGTVTPIRDANFEAYKAAGGKIIQYHGRSDVLVPSALSERYYNGAAKNMNATLEGMQDFYRVFMIPGMLHCRRGPGAWNIGQTGPIEGNLTQASHNALLALQQWVEYGKAPEALVGTKYAGDDISAGVAAQRSMVQFPMMHCSS